LIKEYKIKNLVNFSIENDLNAGNMSSVANGKRKTCAGWRVTKIGD